MKEKKSGMHIPLIAGRDDFLCKRYQLFKKYIRYEVLDNFCVAYMRFCIKMAGDINAVSEIRNSLAWR